MVHYRFHDLFKIRRVNFSFNAQTLLQIPRLIQKIRAIYSKSNKFVLKNRDCLQIPGLINELEPSIQNRRTSFKAVPASIFRSDWIAYWYKNTMVHYRFHHLFKIRRINFSFNAYTLLQIPSHLFKIKQICFEKPWPPTNSRIDKRITAIYSKSANFFSKTVPPLFSGRVESRIDIKTQRFIIAFMTVSKSEE